MWLYQNKPVEQLPPDCQGFVYLITNLVTGRLYVGKKTAVKKITRPPLKGRRLKRHSTQESDWRDYWGSSQSLQADIDQLGHDHFRREILHFCRSRSECNYLEAREQFDRRVLESDLYYNNQIMVRIHGSHIQNKITK